MVLVEAVAVKGLLKTVTVLIMAVRAPVKAMGMLVQTV
jgi:hypothetical protein